MRTTTDQPTRTFGRHMAEEHRSAGCCERCHQDEDRPIYELMTAHCGEIVTGSSFDYRYMCQDCVEKFTHQPLKRLQENRQRFLTECKKVRGRP